MRVKQLKMRSFRGIGDLTLDFDATEPTVLIGINGVGKSSVLDCLAILLSHLIQKYIGDWNNRTKRFFKAQDIKNSISQDFKSEITILSESKELTWSVVGNGFSFSNNLEQLDSLTDTKLPLVIYYPVNRAVLDIALELPQNYIFDFIDMLEQAVTEIKINFNTFFQWFRSCEDLENEERRDDHEYRNLHLEAVRQAIYSLLPNFSNLRVRRSPLRMTVNKNGQELIVNQLSDGEKCLLAMVGDIARRLAIANPSLPDPLQGSGVVLIDEIELHLHPKWQREIIPALTRTFPNCQFIVTTHSPQVVSHVKPEGIYILEATDTGIIAKHPESSYGRDSNRILEDLMGVPERPQEIKNRLRDLFRLIDEGNLDGARELQKDLVAEIGADEPDFASAEVLIRRREILGR
ncbi:MAG: DNA replication and repair protein RecF [Chroococcidiopsis sp. SAG 2025]|uniref:AAA family ATPase n=1 Tax=Chroococcidiopsis sp. SAG 2025 TaxID=171389 RepID=UPI002936F5EB|nr:AAA family ATPase [Chroococcidiopsis sp. SAG 2025]MDV2993308.1 DNA replication and repair protein RecF [Chroococcidiopsis sp. SAG 2025]